MSGGSLSWEEAVVSLRAQPDSAELILNCYYDDPLLGAAQRFQQSEEWQATRRLLPPGAGQALDMGAGRGIASYALACAGWDVVAAEPDPSALVGAGAIRQLARDSGLTIAVVENEAEALKLADGEFDLVYGRAVLHHARDLERVGREVHRVLKPGGRFLAVREHVISRSADLPVFLASHPLHRLYGGENARTLPEYLAAFAAAGFHRVRTLGPFDNAVNFFPMATEDWRIRCAQSLIRRVGFRIGMLAVNERHVAGRALLGFLSRRLSCRDDTPGRLYSFVMDKSL